MNRVVIRAGALLAFLLAPAACSPSDGLEPDLNGGENPEGTIFLAQNVPPEAVMEALYIGKVNRDAQGCLRVEGEGGATVIWPYGFRLQSRSGRLHVLDANGRSIGHIGGEFRMGGGYVPSPVHAHLSDEDRARANTVCASSHYWVVGETD
jgi:hypothetical protein